MTAALIDGNSLGWRAYHSHKDLAHQGVCTVKPTTYVREGRVYERWNGKHLLFPGRKCLPRARRILAEKLCRLLLRWEHSHHKNENSLDDRRSNIVLKTIGEHTRIHWLGRKHSESSLRKMREVKIGKVSSEETRRKISVAQKGRSKSAETRRKMSLAQIGNTKSLGCIRSPETCMKISNSLRGRKFSEEHRRNISLSWVVRKAKGK